MSNKIPKSMKKSVRYVALHALERVEKGGAYSNLLINDAILKGQLSDKDARLLTGLVYGTISRQLLLDYYLSPFLKGAKKLIRGSACCYAFLYFNCFIWIKYPLMQF